jgi:hypothetical protein
MTPQLLRHIPGKLLIVWDGLPGHRSRAVWDFVQQQRGRLCLEFLPAYAPELNPVEYLWSYWKQHELPNFCPITVGQLSHHARQALRRMAMICSSLCRVPFTVVSPLLGLEKLSLLGGPVFGGYVTM